MSTLSEDTKTDRLADRQQELGKLYPTPKTYNQLTEEREKIARLHTRRAPKHIFFMTSIKIYSVVVGLLLAINALPFLMSTGVISGVFLSFLLGLIVYAYALWMMRSISKSFEKITLNTTPLFVSYLCLYPAPAYLLYKFTAHLPIIASLALLTCLHFALVYALCKLITKYARRD